MTTNMITYNGKKEDEESSKGESSPTMRKPKETCKHMHTKNSNHNQPRKGETQQPNHKPYFVPFTLSTYI